MDYCKSKRAFGADIKLGGVITLIELGSIAEELGWQSGDEIISINGHELQDIIDYRFYSSDEFLHVILKRGDETLEYEIEKDFGEPLGALFIDILFDGVRTCGAHCIFCFIEQLPKGLRKSMYFKDDDYRLSFLHGNFVTLGNVSDDDLKRIVEQRLTPLYVSVHATDPALRDKLLGRHAPDILYQIDYLTKGRITLHTQIVLCRGVNDGDHLDKTIEDLAKRYPTVESIAIVPASLSIHRRNLAPIGSIDAEYSLDIINSVKQWQKRFLQEHGTRLLWAADEFYLSAGIPVPSASSYEGYPQLENGIGLVRQFKDSAYRVNRVLPAKLEQPFGISIVTGQSSCDLLQAWADSVQRENLKINVYPITNRLFGETITVTGLIVGKDVIAQLRGKDLGDVLFIPSVSLRDNTFLDDVTVKDVEDALGVPVEVVPPRPYFLARRLVEILRR